MRGAAGVIPGDAPPGGNLDVGWLKGKVDDADARPGVLHGPVVARVTGVATVAPAATGSASNATSPRPTTKRFILCNLPDCHDESQSKPRLSQSGKILGHNTRRNLCPIYFRCVVSVTWFAEKIRVQPPSGPLVRRWLW